jgi:hypothetical protein
MRRRPQVSRRLTVYCANQMLSKTTYLTFTQCPKAFWLDACQPHLAAPPDPAAQRRLQTG